MADDSYAIASGESLYAGIAPAPANPLDAVLDMIAATPTNSWVQLNTNTFSSVWPGDDYRPDYDPGAGVVPASEAAIIKAWSSMGWANWRNSIVLFGGGHANTVSNSVYLWSAETLQWSLGFYPTDVVYGPGTRAGQPVYSPAGGFLTAPLSAHTYSNNHCLPASQLFVTMGGATVPLGDNWAVIDQATGAQGRPLACYTLDISLAGTGKVAGVTGSNVKRGTTAGVNLDGANAWAVRDWHLDHPLAGTATVNGIVEALNHFADVVVEDGKDVIYRVTAGGGSYYRPYRIVINDASDYKLDTIERVGADTIYKSPMGCVHRARNLLVCMRTPAEPIQVWDLNTPGASNPCVAVPVAGMSGDGVSVITTLMSNTAGGMDSAGGGCCGMTYDPVQDTILCAMETGEVIRLDAPASGSLATGWTATIVAGTGVSPRPQSKFELGTTEAATNVGGKWRWADNLRCPLRLQHRTQGQVWAFRPAGWVDPRI